MVVLHGKGRPALALWIALVWCGSAAAAAPDFEADARQLDAALARSAPPPPRVAARGFIAVQARALAADPRFRAAVRKEADRHGPKLAEAVRANPNLFSSSARLFAALLAMQRGEVAERIAARGEREAGRLSAQQAKDARFRAAQAKVEAAVGRAGSGAPPLSSLDATALLAAFLALNIGEDPLPDGVSEIIESVRDEVDSAADQLASCVEVATATRANCLASSADLVSSAICEADYSASMIACFTE